MKSHKVSFKAKHLLLLVFAGWIFSAFSCSSLQDRAEPFSVFFDRSGSACGSEGEGGKYYFDFYNASEKDIETLFYCVHLDSIQSGDIYLERRADGIFYAGMTDTVCFAIEEETESELDASENDDGETEIYIEITKIIYCDKTQWKSGESARLF